MYLGIMVVTIINEKEGNNMEETEIIRGIWKGLEGGNEMGK